MSNSPLISIISSLICSVDLALISFNSSSLFDIITTEDDLEEDEDDEKEGILGRDTFLTRIPWKDDLRLFFVSSEEGLKIAVFDGEANERPNIFASLFFRFPLLSHQ